MSGADRSGPLSPPPAAAGRVGSTVGRAVAALALASTRRPLVTVVISLLLAAAGTLYTLHALTFVTSNLRLLPQKASYVERLKDYQRDFGELNDIVVVVEAAIPDRSKAYAARLVAELERQGLAPSRITYRVDPAYFEGRGLLYLSRDELIKLRDRLFDSQEFIEGYAARPTLPQLLAGINQQIANSMALGFFDVGLRSSGGATDLRFLESVIDQISARLDGQATFTSPWSTAFSVGRFDDPDAGYFFSADRHWLFLFVQQQREEGNFTDSRSTIDAIRRTMAALRPDFPDVEAGVTGGPAISNDEMSSAFSDSEVASILASVLTMALLIAAFRSLLRPVLLMGTLAVSLAWAMGIITLVIGHLSIFSVMFVSIVVGIGVDYGVYWLYRYQEELALEPTAAAAVRRTGELGGPALVLGVLTAMGAFLVLTLTDFQGIREFGFVSGVSIFLAFVSMVTLFPALLALLPRRWTPVATPGQPAIARATWLEGVTALPEDHPGDHGGADRGRRVGRGPRRLRLQHAQAPGQGRRVRRVGRADPDARRALRLHRARHGVGARRAAEKARRLRRPAVGVAGRERPDAGARQPAGEGEADRAARADRGAGARRAGAGARPRRAARASRDPAAAAAARQRGGGRPGQAGGAAGAGEDRGPARQAVPRRPPPGPAGARAAQGQVAGDFADKLTTFQKNLPPRTVVPGDAPPGSGTATSDRAGATCCAYSRPSTSGSGRGRSAS